MGPLFRIVVQKPIITPEVFVKEINRHLPAPSCQASGIFRTSASLTM